jgi:hypothetical protein
LSDLAPKGIKFYEMILKYISKRYQMYVTLPNDGGGTVCHSWNPPRSTVITRSG